MFGNANQTTLHVEETLQVARYVAIKDKVEKDTDTKLLEAASAGTKGGVEAAGTNGPILSPRYGTIDMNWRKCWNNSTIKFVT